VQHNVAEPGFKQHQLGRQETRRKAAAVNEAGVAVIEIEKVEENLLRRTDSESDSHIPLGQVAVFCLKKKIKKKGLGPCISTKSLAATIIAGK